jgi:pSer/pThr/pTyr-binding forkhead associated (FHA) protein
MVQLKVGFPEKADSVIVVRRFPFLIGRREDAGLKLEEPGVWERHARIDLDPEEGFFLEVESGALAAVNGEPIQRSRLVNGDVIRIGSIPIQFWLSEVRQSSFRVREWLTWIAMAALAGIQVWLVYLLSR